MEFSGTFELDDTTTEEVWLALSDPELIRDAAPGCQFLVPVDTDDPDFDALREEHADREPELTLDRDVVESRAFEEGGTYAALMAVSVGSLDATFRAVGTIEEREMPRMVAAGEGSSGNSSFEGRAKMTLESTDGGVAVDWEAEADVFGRIAQMGQRVLNPAANRLVKRFFSSIQDRVEELSAADEDPDGEAGAAATGEGAGAAATGGEPGEASPGEEPGGATAGDEGTDDPGGGSDATSGGDDDAGGGLLARLKRLLGIGG